MPLKTENYSPRFAGEAGKLKTSRKGFTLVELLIYSVIFAGVSLTLIYFLTVFFRVSGYQASSSEVANQANFILEKIQNEIAASSLVIVNDTATSSISYDETDDALNQPHAHLVLKAQTEVSGGADDNASPVLIYKSGANAVLKRGGLAELTLNNTSVAVTNLTFTKVSTPPGKDTVLVGLTLQYQSPNAAERISRDFTLGISRAQAASFDSYLNPNADNQYDIGAVGKKWKSLLLSGGATIDGSLSLTTAGTNTANNSINFLKQGIVSIDPASIGAGGNGTVSVTSSTVPALSGIQTGDRIFVTPPTALEDGLLFMGATAGPDAISIKIKNVSGGAVDGAAQNWSYFVIR